MGRKYRNIEKTIIIGILNNQKSNHSFHSPNVKLSIIKKIKSERNLVALDECNSALFYTLELDNIRIKCQIDTGSSVTLINKRFKPYFHIVKKLPDINLFSYNNSPIYCEGRFRVYIYIQKFGYVYIDIIFVENTDNILGMDFLKKLRCSLYFKDGNYYIYFCKNYCPKKTHCRMTHKQYIPSNSAITKKLFFRAKSNIPLSNSSDYIFESNSTVNFDSLVKIKQVAKGIYYCYLNFLNNSENNVYLPDEFYISELSTTDQINTIDYSTNLIFFHNQIHADACKTIYNDTNELAILESTKTFKKISIDERKILVSKLIDDSDYDITIKRLLKKHYILFSLWEWDLGHTKNNFDFKFDPNFRKNFKSYPVKPENLEKLKINLMNLEELGLISPNPSGFGSPIFFKSGVENKQSRILVDARQVNKHIQECISAQMLSTNTLVGLITKAPIFSKLDITKAYYNIHVSDRVKNSGVNNIITPYGSYTVNCLLSGSLASPYSLTTFLSTLLNQNPKFHLTFTQWVGFYDDIYFMPCQGINIEYTEYLNELDLFLSNLEETNFKFSFQKSQFAICPQTDKFSILGFDVENGRILPNKSRLEALMKLSLPRTLNEHQSFLGSMQYMRHLVPTKYNGSIVKLGSYSSVDRFKIDDIYRKNFDYIKQGLIHAGIAIPRENSIYLLLVDASAEFWGFTLMEVGFESLNIDVSNFKLDTPEVLDEYRHQNDKYSIFSTNVNLFQVLYEIYLAFSPKTKHMEYHSFCSLLIDNILNEITHFFNILLIGRTKREAIELVRSLFTLTNDYHIGKMSPEIETALFISFSSVCKRQICFVHAENKFYVGIKTPNPNIFVFYNKMNNSISGLFNTESLTINIDAIGKKYILNILAKKIEQKTYLPFRPLYYFTKKFDSKTIGKYIYLKELSAISYSLAEVSKHFDMSKVCVLTDSLPSYYLLQSNKSKNRRSFETVCEIISKYPYINVCHIQGKANFADVFSRPVGNYDNDTLNLDYYLPQFDDFGSLLHFSTFRDYLMYRDRLSAENEKVKKVGKSVVDDRITKKYNLKFLVNDSFFESYLNNADIGAAYTQSEIEYASNKSFRQILSIFYDENKLFVPKTYYTILISYLHSSSNHKGREFIISTIFKNYHIQHKSYLRDCTANFISACILCALNNPSSVNYKLGTTLLNQRAKQLVSFDIMFLTSVKSSRANFFSNQIMVFVDHYTKFLSCYFLSAGTEAEITKSFLSFFSSQGIPASLLCDNQTSFVSSTPIKLCNLFGIKYINSSAYRSESRGLIERTIRTIRNLIRKVLSTDMRICPQAASALAVHIYNNSHTHTTNNFTPTSMHYNLTENTYPFLYNHGKSKFNVTRNALNRAVRTCLDKINKKKHLVLKRKNKRRANINFEIGDLVLVRARSKNKNYFYYNPPIYKIIQVFSFQLMLERLADLVHVLVHIKDVKKISRFNKKFLPSQFPIDKLGLLTSDSHFIVDVIPDNHDQVITRSRQKRLDKYIDLKPIESEPLFSEDEDEKNVTFG